MTWLELILVLLAAAVALQIVAVRFGIPHPALLVLGGAALALIPGLPRPALEPDVIFLVFVPPLLYIASAQAPVRELRQQIGPIFLLSVPLVLITMTVVAVAAHALSPEMTWATAFVLGAIVAPPDPVAAVAVMRPLRAPRTLTAILEGEGMFNDVTALVAYRIAVAASVTGAFSLASAALEFVWTGILGLLLGLLLGRAALAIRIRVQGLPLVDNSLSLLTPFAVYMATAAVGGSGVMAVVAAGLYVGQRLNRLSPESRIQAITTWNLVAFLLENLVFILVGLELPYLIKETRPDSLVGWLSFAGLVSLIVILIRLALVLPAPAAWHALTRRRFSPRGKRGALLVGWMGVRGADSVVIALALPAATSTGGPFPARALIVFTTFGVVFATLVLQGLTVGPLARRLGLNGDSKSKQEEAHARHVVADAGLKRLDQLAETGSAFTEIIGDLRNQLQHRARRWETSERRLGGTSIGSHDPGRGDGAADLVSAGNYQRIRREMIDAERRATLDLRDRGIIGADVVRRIERDLDLEALLLEKARADELPRSGKHHGASGPRSRR